MVPGTAFVVARTAHRNNSSSYYVDGRKSSFGEVTALLKGKGIDLDNNRFLILQVRNLRPAFGEEEAVLSMCSREVRPDSGERPVCQTAQAR